MNLHVFAHTDPRAGICSFERYRRDRNILHSIRAQKWQQSHSIDAHIRDILINTISSLFAAAIVTTGGLVIAPPGPIHAFILANFAWLLACTLLFILAVSMSIYAVVLQRERAARLIE